MRVRVWGTRGSVPTAHAASTGYGGNTPCVELEPDGGQRLILDGGTGLHWLGGDLLEAGFSEGHGQAHILLSHTHWAHIQGIPFTTPMLVAGNRFTVHGSGNCRESLVDLLTRQMDSTYCPVPNFLEAGIGADLDIAEIDQGEFEIGRTRVRARRLNHVPGTVCLGYRIDSDSGSLAYLPDVEYLEPAHREPALDLADGAELLIHDAHFTAAEYPQKCGQGHACDRDAVEIAREAGVGRLFLFHHHPDRTDAALDQIARCYQDQELSVQPAREGIDYLLETEPDPASQPDPARRAAVSR